jgi:phage gp37-like protein
MIREDRAHRGGPTHDIAVWLATGGASEESRRRAVAHALRVARWDVVVEAVVQEEPSASEQIVAEFEAVQD